MSFKKLGTDALRKLNWSCQIRTSAEIYVFQSKDHLKLIEGMKKTFLRALYTNKLLLVLAARSPIAELSQELTLFRMLDDESIGGKRKQKLVRVERPLLAFHDELRPFLGATLNTIILCLVDRILIPQILSSTLYTFLCLSYHRVTSIARRLDALVAYMSVGS